MKNIKFILIILGALFLRINYDTFISGYNFDELAIVSSAVQSFPIGILKATAQNDYHAPLYQLIIHFFTYFNPEWVYMRLFNAILSIINIFVFYKIGCLLNNKKTGCYLAMILAVNHLAISAVSFVKFYTLLFLLVSVSIYYFIKILKYGKSFYKFAINNIAIILTGTYGFIFVFLEYLFLVFIRKNKKLFNSFLMCLVGFFIYFPILTKQISLNFSNLFSPHGSYADFSLVSLYDMLNDFFAPLLNYCCNLQTVSAHSILALFYNSLYGNISYHYLAEFIIFSLLPVIIALYFALKAVKKSAIVRKIAFFAMTFLIIFVILTKFQITGFIPIYLYPVFIIFLMCFGTGISQNKPNKALFVLYILINLAITNVYPSEKRDFDYAKSFYVFEQYYKTHKNPAIIATTGGRFLKNYYRNKNIIDMDYEKMSGKFKKDFIGYIFGENIKQKINKNNAFELLAPLILNNYKDKEFEKYFIDNIYNKISKNDKIIFTFQSYSNSPFIEGRKDYVNQLQNLKYCPTLNISSVKNQKECLDTSLMAYIVQSYGYEYFIELLEKYFKRVNIEQYTKTDDDNWVKTFEDISDEYSTLFLAQNAMKSWIFAQYQKQ